jgi:hypothetical protein
MASCSGGRDAALPAGCMAASLNSVAEPTPEQVERWAKLASGPLPEAHAHEAARARFRALTLEQKRQTFIDAGIYFQDGRLRPEYGG